MPVRESPPSIDELREVLAATGGDLRKLFNVAGGDYREMGMKDRLPKMSESEALALLSTHGNLVKRPLVVGQRLKTAGFKPEEWAAALGD
jgi:arsenate reductase